MNSLYDNIPAMKEECSKYYYVFIGQNATTGTANKQTGQYSNYGNILCFKYKVDAKRYVSEFYSNISYQFAVAGSAMSLRRFKRGLSVRDYLSDLLMMDALTYDDQGCLQ